MNNVLAMKVGEAYAKSRSSQLADEIWTFKNPEEPIDTRNREYLSWKNSLRIFLDCAHEAGLDNVIVVFEMKTPVSNKAIDVLLIGKSNSGENRILIVELKQWERITVSNNEKWKSKSKKGDKVYVPEADASRRHPFKQLNLYENNLANHHSGIQKAKEKGINFKIDKIAYLHNFKNKTTLFEGVYEKWQPFSQEIFGGGEKEKALLTGTIEKWFTNTYEGQLLEILEDYDAILGDEGLVGLRRAYKNEASLSMMQDQQEIVNFVVEHLKRQQQNPRQEMLIISGGPGTGKTIVGIRFILEYVKLFNKGSNDNKVIFCLPKSQTVKAMFDAACSVEEENENEYCCYLDEISENQNLVVVDEAHRITKLDETLDKVFNKGTKLLILLQDDHQLLRPGEQGTFEAFRQYAQNRGIGFSPVNAGEHQTLTLIDEKRCDEALLNGITRLFYDQSIPLDKPIETIKVFNDTRGLEAWKNQEAQTSRTKYIFPFCWSWGSRNDSSKTDIKIGSFVRTWNPEDTDDQVVWLNDNKDDRVACIYTSQGLDMDNVAFVWWDDLTWDEQNKKWKSNPNRLKDPAFRCEFNSRSGVWEQTRWDRSLNKEVLVPDGYRLNQTEMDLLIKNTYYVMLSRPRKSVGIWFKDEATKRHVVEVLGLEVYSSPSTSKSAEEDSAHIVIGKPEAEPKTQDSIIGNKLNKSYHKSDCQYAPRKPEKRVEFKSVEEARIAGFRPCPTCNP